MIHENYPCKNIMKHISSNNFCKDIKYFVENMLLDQCVGFSWNYVTLFYLGFSCMQKTWRRWQVKLVRSTFPSSTRAKMPWVYQRLAIIFKFNSKYKFRSSPKFKSSPTITFLFSSSSIFRAFYIPFVSEHYTSYVDYNILKRKRNKQKRWRKTVNV